MKDNIFIALEGIDGSGKSTQAKMLAQKLQENGNKVYSTFEPTTGPIGTMIRSVLRGELKMDERVIAGLFVADRLDHLLNKENGILLKLEQGYTVITDRYYFSSYAYHGTHMDMDWVIASNAMSAQLLRPDITLFIDVAPEVSMLRLQERNEKIEIYETLENLRNVRTKYMEAFERLGNEEHIVLIEGNRSLEAISHDLYNHAAKLL